MIETQLNRVKIDTYSDGHVITIIDKNWVKTGHFKTPCYVNYQGQMIELHNDYLIYHTKERDYYYEGTEFQKKLPQLLEFGKLLPRDEENNPIFKFGK